VAIAGDLVQSGGEQRDWDEFWAHNSDAGSIFIYCTGAWYPRLFWWAVCLALIDGFTMIHKRLSLIRWNK